MLNPLSQVINSYSTNSQLTVQSLVRDMKVDKVEIQNIINRLSTFNSGPTFAVSNIGPLNVMDKQILFEMFRDGFLRIQRLFSGMNGVGLAINSMAEVLAAEIDKAEKDIENLELFINNYEFTSGKDDLYTFSYIEKFNDYLGSYKYDGSSFSIPDRDNTVFPDGGNGFVDSSVGVFKFGSDIKYLNVIDNIKDIKISTNYDNYVTSSSDFINLFTETLYDSWNVTIKSPTILSSNLSNYSQYLPYDYSLYNGAQTVVDVTFRESILIDTLRFSGNSSGDMQLMQLCIATSDDASFEYVLNDSIKLRSIKEVSFDKRQVKRLLLIFNQPTYLRSKIAPLISEQNAKGIASFINERVSERISKFSKYQDIVYWYLKSRIDVGNVAKNKSEYDFYSNKFPLEHDRFMDLVSNELFTETNFSIDYKYDLIKSPALLNLIQSSFLSLVKDNSIIDPVIYRESSTSTSRKLLDIAGNLFSDRSNDKHPVKDQYWEYPISGFDTLGAAQAMLTEESVDSYEYLFSLRSIDFIETNNSKVNKASFVSKRIPVSSQVTALKAKIDSINSVDNSILKNYDLKDLVSYELSISGFGSPILESNWYPVSFNDQTSIPSEVVFFDTKDYSAKLRFNAVVDSIFLYKDGILCAPSTYSYNPVTGIIRLLDEKLFSPSSIFCVKYDLELIQNSPNELDFIKNNLVYDSIRTYGSVSGSGQEFLKTNSQNAVTLEYTPYVNFRLAQNTSYANSIGTIFNGDTTGYSPVRIKLSDGSYAINLTNYTGRPQRVQFYQTSSTLFIQNGKNIIFNKSLDSKFTVLYDYVPSSLRFRLIARKNIDNLNTSLQVDNVILKMKTLDFDPIYDKLNAALMGS